MNIPTMGLAATVIRNTLLAAGGFCGFGDDDDDDDFDDDDDDFDDDDFDVDDDDDFDDDDAQHMPVCRITLDVEWYKEALSRISAGK